MFGAEYTFRGRHAKRVKELVGPIINDTGSKFFQRNVDVLLTAPIVGFLYQRAEPEDKSTRDSTKIFLDQMVREDEGIKFNFQVTTLLSEGININEKLDYAFRKIGKEVPDEVMDTYENYIRGGVDILYEKLIEDGVLSDDFLMNLYEFVEEINIRYDQQITDDDYARVIAIGRKFQ